MGQRGFTSGMSVFYGKRSFRRIFFAAALSLLAIPSAFCTPAPADQLHYINTLIGDRASGMGGAYTALSDDATGLYYNPAGIVYAAGRDLTVSANVYSNITRIYKGAIGRFDWERRSSALLPNYFGMVQPMGAVKIGFSYAVPDSTQDNQDQTFTDVSQFTKTYVFNFHTDDSTYNVGPSIAAPIRDDLSVGLTLYYHLRRRQYVQNELVLYDTPTYGWANRFYELIEKGFRPVIGLMWLPVEKMSVGFSLSQVFLYDATTTQQDTCSDSNVSGQGCNPQLFLQPVILNPSSRLFLDNAPSKAKRKFPLQAALGAAYYLSPDLLLSGDMYYYSKVTDDPVGGNREAIANFALGAEYSLSKTWIVRGGLFTDLAHTPEVSASGANQLEHVDLYGVSTSIRHYTTDTASVTLGGSFTSGSGKAQIVGGRNDIQDLDVTAWTLFLSSSYSY
jgi:long-chain fatty acid transport protein